MLTPLRQEAQVHLKKKAVFILPCKEPLTKDHPSCNHFPLIIIAHYGLAQDLPLQAMPGQPMVDGKLTKDHPSYNHFLLYRTLWAGTKSSPSSHASQWWRASSPKSTPSSHVSHWWTASTASILDVPHIHVPPLHKKATAELLTLKGRQLLLICTSSNLDSDLISVRTKVPSAAISPAIFDFQL